MEQTEAPKELSSAEIDIQKNELQELLQALEQHPGWDGRRLYQFNGFWFAEKYIPPILSSQKHFKSHDTDIILATMPKSGTTWLKALTFSIVNRKLCALDQSPLLTCNPHGLVPFLDFDLYWRHENPDLDDFSCPRIFSVHMPYEVIPRSICESECKIIYICRNPLDQFISHRHFLAENKAAYDFKLVSFDEAFDLFCRGIYPLGPFWGHILGYWNAHLKNPQKVLFLKYEDLKEDIVFHVKKIAQFIGLPFSLEEEKQGLVEQICRLCSFENLKSLEVNRTGLNGRMKNSSYFRKGDIGDWTNYLTPAVAERYEKLLETELEGSGLTFETYKSSS